MYSWPRFVSMAGELPHTAPPLYPAGTVYVFQSVAPVARSSASMLPRNVQHTYVGSIPCAESASSCEATPTKTFPSNTVGDCVMMADRCDSACVLHTSAPVNLLNASTFPPGPHTKLGHPNARLTIEPCVPTITKLSVTAGVSRARSTRMPLAAGMLAVHFNAPVRLSTTYRFPAQSGK